MDAFKHMVASFGELDSVANGFFFFVTGITGHATNEIQDAGDLIEEDVDASPNSLIQIDLFCGFFVELV